jgi:hypothetical protein
VPKPLCIDVFAGTGGWTEGFLAEGWDCIGFDIERHDYGPGKRYPAQLVLQDALTIDGKQFKDAQILVMSPPCQFFSYTSMPWSKAKKLAADVQADPARLKKELALFDACFRIQREACEAAGRHIPMIVENVKGAQKWVGRAQAHFGSFYLWGNVPALMPVAHKRGSKNDGGSWFNIGSPGQKELNRNPVHDGVKQHKSGRAWFADPDTISGSTASRSPARKAASAQIARIPFPLAQYIARVFRP